MARDIEPISIQSSGRKLFGVYHSAGKNDCVVVMCPPFAEEKKASYRVLYEQAQALASAGVPVLRFDYSGTGDSDGAFEESTADQWIEDIAAASEFARTQARTEQVCLLGLRLGGTLAASFGSDRLVLWQPLMDPHAYLRGNLKRQAMRRKLVGGESGPVAGEIDGYTVTDALGQSIERLHAEIVHDNCLLVQISYADKILPEYASYRERRGIDLRTIRLEPFWNRLGRVDAGELIRLTTEWIVRSSATAPS